MVNKTVWCHAVSVGEVRAVAPMLALLEEDERAQGRIALSTVTVTGQATAIRECGYVKSIFYFPLDLPFVTVRAIRRVDPEIFITAETEIWPNFFQSCFRRSIPVVVVNGRISDDSFSRYLKFRWFFRPILQRVSLFLMQSEEDAKRIREMGADPGTVKVTGNMKYDRKAEPAIIPERIIRWADTGFLLVAGSTHRGEEEMILDAVDDLDRKADVLTALVPRHPERFGDVADLLKSRDLTFSRYSEVATGSSIKGDVLLVDTMGVLEGFYALADVAFVGGSLVPVGGHNLLEPAMHGVPILTGPYTHNFREITISLTERNACRVVSTREEFSSTLEEFLDNEDSRRRTGQAAKVVSGSAIGATERNCRAIGAFLGNKGDKWGHK
jgi:3-deoxy-D-manno-octulosonic-acid transferase